MKHMIDAIDVSIKSIENTIKVRQSAIRNGSAEELFYLHQHKDIYKPEVKNANVKRSKAQNAKTVRVTGK